MRSVLSSVAAALVAVLFLIPSGAAAQAVPHLGVSAKSLVMVELTVTVDPATQKVSHDVGVYQAGSWRWFPWQAAFDVPKEQSFVVTDAQAYVLHDTANAPGSSLELQLQGPSGYSGTMAIFPFDDVAPNQRGVQRQSWTSGFVVPGGHAVRVETFANPSAPSMLLQARVLLHGYFVP